MYKYHVAISSLLLSQSTEISHNTTITPQHNNSLEDDETGILTFTSYL